jgi:hypothetical protein
MKKIYIILLALSVSCGLQSQIIFESDLSNWNDSTPNDWFGFKTNIEADSVDEVTTGATYGTSLAALVNNESQHRRFTSELLSLVEGETYEVEFWVRGNGEIRTNLFDGDLDGGDSGYGNYNPYVIVASNTVESYVQIVSPDTTYDAMELILSTRNGTVEVDRVELRIGIPVDPVEVSIYDIQFTTDASGDSPVNNLEVVTSGVVTAVADNGYYMQDADESWSGIFVEDFDNVPAIGDEIMISALVEEFFNFTRLHSVDDYTVVSSGNAFQAVVDGSANLNDEKYEGLFVLAEGLCSELPNQYGEWLINDGSGDIMIDDQMFIFDPTLSLNYQVMGPMNYSFGAFKVEPRDGNDVSQVSALVESEVALFSMYPNPVEDVLIVQTASDMTNAEILIYDTQGRLVKAVVAFNELIQIDVNDLSAGSYTVQLVSEGLFSTSSLVIR